MTEQEKSFSHNRLRTPRAAAFAGIVFSVLFIISMILIRLSVPVDPWEENNLLHQQWQMVSIALNLLPFCGIAFLWFIGVLRDRIGALEDRFFATVFFGSGLLFLALLFVIAGLAGSIITIYGPKSEKLISSEIYHFVRILIYHITHIYMMRMEAVFMFCASTIAIRTAILPRWMAFAGYALGLLLLLSLKFVSWIPLVFPIWVLATSIYILLVNLKTRTA